MILAKHLAECPQGKIMAHRLRGLLLRVPLVGEFGSNRHFQQNTDTFQLRTHKSICDYLS